MINLIRADWYQFRQRKTVWINFIILLILPFTIMFLLMSYIKSNPASTLQIITEDFSELIIPEGASALDFVRNSKDFHDILISDYMFLSDFVYFIVCINIVKFVYNDERKNRTFINTFSYGFKRRDVILSKFILSIALMFVMLVALGLAFAFSIRFFLHADLARALTISTKVTIESFPSYILGAAVLLFFANFKGDPINNIMILILVSVVIGQLFIKVDGAFPILSKLRYYLPHHVIFTSSLYEKVPYWTYFIYTSILTLIILAVTERLLEESEIK